MLLSSALILGKRVIVRVFSKYIRYAHGEPLRWSTYERFRQSTYEDVRLPMKMLDYL